MPFLANARHERFAQELAAGKTATEAYELAGFKPNRHNAATLAHKHHISDRTREILTERKDMHERAVEKAVEKLSLTREWVLARLVTNVERAMQASAVLDDDGNAVGLNIAVAAPTLQSGVSQA